MGVLVDLTKVRELLTVADLCFRTADDFDPKRREILLRRGRELRARAATLSRGGQDGMPAERSALAG